MTNLNQAPQAVRRHIAIFGRRNVGKSSLINAITGQQVAIVSPEAGTTTDPVNRAMEIHSLGPCLLIDTAGYDDEGNVGELRNERTRKVLDQADMAMLVFDQTQDLTLERQWLDRLQQIDVPVVLVLNKTDLNPHVLRSIQDARKVLGSTPVPVSATEPTTIDRLRQAMIQAGGGDEELSLTGRLAKPGDTVLLVMPQDPQAPKGRLILPQVQTLRDLMDKRCIAICCTTEDIDSTLASLQAPPHLIITDSQVFDIVEKKKPAKSLLTSFSVLMAAHKGDINYFVHSAAAIDHLTEKSRILIAEACTHAPLAEDIGREKIPRMLRQRVGQGLTIDIVAGKDFPADLLPYDLIIHCGGCMFNGRFMLQRVEQCRRQSVPMTNYGIVIAHIKGILDKVSLP